MELEVPVEEVLNVEYQAFAVTHSGKCSVVTVTDVGGGAFGKQAAQYTADGATT